jgi:polar amino acid transport system substrate-binding protein
MKRFAILIVLLLAVLFLSRGLAPTASGERVFRIARDVSWYPLEVRGKEKNIQAFVDELLQRVAAQEQIRVELISAPWDTHIPLIDQGTTDAVVTGLLPTKRFTDRYAFSKPVLALGPVLLVAKDSTVQGIEDLQDKILGVQAGVSTSFDLPDASRVRVKMYIDLTRAVEDVARGEIEAVVVDNIRGHLLTQGLYSQRLRLIDKPLNQVGLRLMTAKDERADLIEVFNEQLVELQRTGVYQELLDKWNVLQ